MDPTKLTTEQAQQVAAAALEKYAAENQALSDQIIEHKAALERDKAERAELQRQIAEMRSTPMWGGGEDNGVAGGDRSKNQSIIKRHVLSTDATTGQQNSKLHYVKLGKDDGEMLKSWATVASSLNRGQSVSSGWLGLKTHTITEGNNESAGFAVSEEWSSTMWEKMFEDAWWLQNGNVYPMTSDSVSGPELDQTFGSSPSYDGGITFTWESEVATKTEDTNPSLHLKSLRAKDCRGLQKISRNLEMDSPWFLSWITNRLPIAHARELTAKIWNGNGGTQPLGFLTADIPTGLDVARTTASQFRRADMTNLFGALDEAFGMMDLRWFMRRAANADFGKDTTVDTSWTDASRSLIEFPFLGGMPVEITKHASALGTRGDVVLCDPQSYLIGLRLGFTLEFARELYMASNQIGLFITSRIDGQPLFGRSGFAVLDDAA